MFMLLLFCSVYYTTRAHEQKLPGIYLPTYLLYRIDASAKQEPTPLNCMDITRSSLGLSYMR